MVNVLEAMAKDSWPNGVTSWDDTVKFAQLVFGEKVSVADYSNRLPRPSERSFLLFAKGACGPGTPFREIGALIDIHFEEVKQYELGHRRNNQRPEKSQQMLGSDNWKVHYWSTQLTRAPCTCRSGFGADAHQKHVPTASDMWATGERFAELWNVTLQKNFASFRDRRQRPIWLDKTWQAVWNWNDHNQGHGIALHPDECDTYSSSDPITSFSFGHGGVLLLSDRKAAASKMLFQADGDALVMAGEFQSEFWHGVPERASWSELRSRSMFDGMQLWEQLGLIDEIKKHKKAVDGEQHVRKNCTIRWHATHWDNCPSKCEGNEVRSGVAVRNMDAAQASGSSEMRVPTLVGSAFAGVKRPQDGVEVCEELSSVKSSRSLDTVSSEMARKMLELVESASNSQLYRSLMLGMKLVGSQALHDENLCKLEATILNLRSHLLSAQETVAGYGEKFAAKVSFADLDATALAAQQLRLIHRHLGALGTKEGGSWLIETVIDPIQNRLSDHTRYSKCLMSHRVLELVLDAVSVTEMQRHMEIALDLKMLAKGMFPANLTSLKRKEKKKKKKEDMGFELKQIPANSVVLVKCLEIGYVKQIAAGRRLLARESGLKSLMQAVDPANIRATLQTTFRLALERLRTLDVERQYCDRYDGTLASANYDIWIWLWVVE